MPKRPRPTVAIDVELPRKPRIAALSDAAYRIFIDALCYCGEHRTDGLVPRRVALLLHAVAEPAIAELVRGGLWHEAPDGYEVSEYLTWQLSRDDWDQLSDARAAAGRRGAEARWGKASSMASAMASAMANGWQDQDQDHDQDHDQDQDQPPATAGGVIFTPEVERLCSLMADHVEQQTGKRPVVGKRWLNAMRLLIDRDSRSPAEVEACIAWVGRHDFWAANVLSVPTLRKQYGRLRAQAQQERQRATRSSGAPDFKAAAERLRQEGR
jgi:hypothetical protein